MQLLARDLGDLSWRLSPDDGIEEPVDQGIRVSLPRDADKPTVEEASML